jgi:hypothetical protein
MFIRNGETLKEALNYSVGSNKSCTSDRFNIILAIDSIYYDEKDYKSKYR